jgi:hypothetical protein
LHRRS